MPELNDHELLAEFARTESETAFAALVARHVNLAYSTALRFTGNPHHAEEITQAVFIILARKAGKLSPRVVLSGWLYQVARFTAANFVKGEIRRHRREQEAYMQTILNEPDAMAWKQMAPLLDDAMGGLGETERNAVVLRFFENKTAAEVAGALKLTEAAAHKRVNRALEKLRKFLTKRGVTLSSVAIAGAISANSVQAAPVALAKVVTAVAIVKGSIATASTLTLVKETIKIMAYAKLKLAIGVTAIILLAGGAVTVALSDNGTQTSSPANSRPNSTVALADQTNGQMVAIGSQFVVVPNDSIGKLGLTWQPAESGGTMSVLDKSQSSAAMQALEQTAGAEFLRSNGGGPTSGKTVRNGSQVTTSGMMVKESVTKPVGVATTNADIEIVLYVTPFYSSGSSSYGLNLTNELHEAQTTISSASVTLESGQTIVMRQAIAESHVLDKSVGKSSDLLVFVTPSLFKAGSGMHKLK